MRNRLSTHYYHLQQRPTPRHLTLPANSFQGHQQLYQAHLPRSALYLNSFVTIFDLVGS